MKQLLCAASVLLLCSCVIVSGHDKLLDTRTETLSTEGISRVRLDVGAGFLKITGDPEARELRLHAEFKGQPSLSADEQDILEQLELDWERDGDTLKITTKTGDWHHSGQIDLTLTLPHRLDLDIEDGSGSVTVREMGGRVSIQDGSGGIEMDRIDGSVEISDGSGGIELTDIGGGLRIHDGSGSIKVRDTGSVLIKDSSGGISVARVRGDIEIRDGSGSITVEDVDGNLDVPSDGSGSIRHSDVRGRVNIPRRKR